MTIQNDILVQIDSGKNFLAHFGVMGMKWGKHLPGRNQRSHNPKPQKRRDVNPDHAEAHTLRKQPISTLSTAELHKVNSRLQAEKKYRDLNPSVVERGQNKTKKILSLVGTSTAVAGAAVAFSKTPAGQAAISRGAAVVSKFLTGGGGRHVVTTVVKTARHL